MKKLNYDSVKPNFTKLKKRWHILLQKYFLDKNILNPEFTIEVACPHCKSLLTKDVFNLNGFWHRTCTQCDSVYVSPRLNNKVTTELYSDSYYNEHYAISMIPAFSERKEIIGQNKFKQSIKYWNKEKELRRVLDVGGGIGEVIDVFKDHFWYTHITEMNSDAIEYLNTKGYSQVFHGALDDFISHFKFDIIMAWGVVEHVINPDVFLQKINNFMTDDGLFVSEVPNGQSFLVDFFRKNKTDPQRILMGEQHIILYPIQAYIHLHERNGFELVHIQTNGLDINSIFKELNINIDFKTISIMQECIDEKNTAICCGGFGVKK